MARKGMLLTGLIALIATFGTAQQHEHAMAAEKLGTVSFATSCNPAAQKQMNHAVALLHSFQFSRAIDGFNAALIADKRCAIAYWGIALSDWGNPFAPGVRGASQLEPGLQAAEHGDSVRAKTAREREYVTAVSKLYADYKNKSQRERVLAYRDAMSEVAQRHPEDKEASIFYALALTASEEPGDKTYASRLKAGAILEKLFAEQPDHPGLAHYIIHAYDVPSLAARALPAARRYAEIAPDAPHAMHMPSHIFTRVGYWQDSIASNRGAAQAASRAGQVSEQLHSLDYETYAYLQTGQDEAARQILDALPEIKAHFDPKSVQSGAAPSAGGYFPLAAIPARYALERRDWSAAAKLDVSETPYPYVEAMSYFARGIGAAHLGDVAGARAAAAELDKLRQRLSAAGEAYWAQQVEIQQRGVIAWASLAEGKNDDALKEMRAAAEMEDGTEKAAINPGPLAPGRELLGEMLLQLNQPGEALEEFKATLKSEPNRFHALYGAAHAAQLAGDQAASRKYFGELLKVTEAGDKPGRKELAEARAAVSGGS